MNYAKGTIQEALTGTGVALVTPFNKDLSIDFGSLGKLIDHVIEGGVEIFKLNTALAFKFLNKVVAPAQAGQEVIEVAFVRHQMPVLPAVLISLPEADVAPGQIG